MKKLFKNYSLLLITLLITSCGGDDSVVIGEENNDSSSYTLSGTYSDSKTLSADNIWTLKGRVTFTSGTTLTIPAGTIIKAQGGTGTNASTLIIARGAKIDAQGTASNPIVMTSVADDIEVGQKFGTNLNENNRGLWGGLLILGYAPCSFENDVTQVQIEGIPVTDTNGLYGGDDATDNSGIVKYISIRHGGALIGDGNEINGLTLGGVGSGTVIENIEVVGNVDDGIEFFGGTVDASNLLVWGQGDDGLDIDQAYSGTIDNAMVIAGNVSDHRLEIDGPEGAAEGSFILKNVTLIGSEVAADGEYADYRSNAMGASENIFAYGFQSGKDVELDNDGVATNFNSGKLNFASWEIIAPAGVTVADIFQNKAETVTVSNFGDFATLVTTGTVGANAADFAWTYAKEKGAY